MEPQLIALIGGGLILLLYIALARPKKRSQFGLREADRDIRFDRNSEMSEARVKKKETLRLEGITIDAPANEILGVPPDASESEIQSAYRNKMKQYHPDKLGPPGSRQAKDGQEIARAINQAKEEMLSKLKR